METELESMVVRLLGDGSSYAGMMQQAQTSTMATMGNVERAGSRIEGITASMGAFAKTVALSLGALGVVSWLSGASSAWADQAGAVRRLNAVMEINQRDVATLGRQYADFADQIQRTTKVQDDTVLVLARQAELHGITGEAAQRAIQNSIALAEVKGGEAESYLRMTVALEQGNSSMLSRMLPALRMVRDESERNRKAHELLGKMWEYTKKEAQSLGGQIEQLKNAYNDLQEDFGEVISLFTKPIKTEVVAMLREGVAWLKSWSQEAKIVVIALAGISAGLLGLGPAWKGIVYVYGLVKGLFLSSIGVIASIAGALGGPLTIAFLAVGTVAAVVSGVIVNHFGGIIGTWNAIKGAAASAWVYIKAKTTEFLEWVRPIWQAIKALGVTAWDMTKNAVYSLWEVTKDVLGTIMDYAAEIWTGMFGDVTVNWTDIRNFIRDTILFLEFALIHWKDLADFTWIAIQLGAVTAFEEIKYWLGTALPYTVLWFFDNLEEIAQITLDWMSNLFMTTLENIWMMITSVDWEGAWNSFKSTAEEMGGFMYDIGTEAMAAFRAGMSGEERDFGSFMSDEMNAGTDAFLDNLESRLREVPAIARNSLRDFRLPPRVTSEMENFLREEFDLFFGAIEETWQEFRARRLLEFGMDPEARDRAEESGRELGKGFNRGLDKEMQKTENVLAGSAEALSRIAAFKDKLADMNRREGGNTNTQANNAAANNQANITGQAQAQQNIQVQRDQLAVLQRVAQGVDRLAARPPVTIEVEGVDL